MVNAVAAASSLVFLFGARSHSYFAGALKKDDRVLVPDLGCLTNIHDMRVVREKKILLLPYFSDRNLIQNLPNIPVW